VKVIARTFVRSPQDGTKDLASKAVEREEKDPTSSTYKPSIKRDQLKLRNMHPVNTKGESAVIGAKEALRREIAGR